MRQTIGRVGASLAVLIALGGATRADTIDLTTSGSSGTINGAVFQQINPQSTGTGVIQPFLRLQNTGVERGYNTDARPVQFDEKTDPNFTRSLLLSDVPIVNINGTNYRQFLLDINEKNTPTGRLLTLDQLQIFQSPRGDLNDYPNLGTKVYDLGNNEVLLNYGLNHGSGSGDMFAYIPDSLFDPSIPFVTLFSEFGDADGDADAGFEEWAVLKGSNPVNAVPAPATLVFAGIACGLGLVGCARRRLRDRRTATPAS